MTRQDCDVIVVGAGMAGAAAALKLGQAGKKVKLIEARDRCGGRGFVRNFADDPATEALEFGGAWITPWHNRIRARVAELGLSLRPRHQVSSRLWLRNGTVTADGPASRDDCIAHDRAIARVAGDSILLKKGLGENEKGEPLRGVSFADYLDRLGAPKATRDMFSAWWTVSGNGDHRTVAASEFLASCSYDGGLAEGMIRFWTDTVVPGMGVLAERMIEASGAERILSEPVTNVVQVKDGVQVASTSRVHEAKACVLALGINQLRRLSFTPALPEPKREAIRLGHGGRSFKLWIKAEGVPAGTLVTGDGSGIEFAFAERKAKDGATLIVCFGLMTDENHPEDPTWVQAQASKLFPNARMMSYDWHDWVDDPFARGTWVAALAGHEEGLDSANWQPEGRIAFASSDYARDQAGWFEGAVIAGEDAADAVLAMRQS
jgi:monoamine oxidase